MGSQRIRHDWATRHARTSCFLSATCWKDCPLLTHFSHSCKNHLSTHVKFISGLSVLSDGIYACIYATTMLFWLLQICGKFCSQGLWVLFFLILLLLQKISLEFWRRLCWIHRSLCIIDIWILSLLIHEHGNHLHLFLCFSTFL